MVEGGAGFGQLAGDGVEARRGFRLAGEPFITVVREGGALCGSAFGFATEAVERGGGVAFGFPGIADLVAGVGELLPIRRRGGGGHRSASGGERLGGLIALSRETGDGLAQGGAAQGEALHVLLGADGGLVRLCRGVRQVRHVAACGHQGDFGVGELLGGPGALFGGEIAGDAGGRDFRHEGGAARALFQLFSGGQRRIGRPHETIPAPEIAFAADEALAGLQLRDEGEAVCAVDEAALRQARHQFGGRFDERAERRRAARQAGAGIAMAAGPVDGRGGIGGRVEIVVQRGGEGAFKAGRAHAIHHRRSGGGGELAQQAIEPLELGFQLAQLAFGGEQRRRQTCFKRTRIVDRAQGCRERRLRGLRLCFGVDMAGAGILQRLFQFRGFANGGEFGLGAGKF